MSAETFLVTPRRKYLFAIGKLAPRHEVSNRALTFDFKIVEDSDPVEDHHIKSDWKK